MKFFLNKTKKKLKTGFTLIEALVSVFIVSIVGIIVYCFQKDISNLNRTISENLLAQTEARRVLKIMGSEIRSAAPSSLGAYPLAQTTGNSLIFYSNIDSDSYKEKIRYFADGSIIKRGVTKPSGTPLVYNPANEIITDLARDTAQGGAPIFYYYDQNYDGTTLPMSEPVDISAVRLIKILILIDKNPERPPGPVIFTTQISLRNLKDNL